MNLFMAGFTAELVKLADSGGGGFGAGGVAQVDSDLAKTRKEEDKATGLGNTKNRVHSTFYDTNPDFPGKIRPGQLGQQGGGPLMADPSRWPTNRLTS
jgi:hypothetical protein